MNNWPSKKMSEITRLVTDGKHGDCEDEDGSGYFFLSSKDLRDGRLHYDRPRQITFAGFLETHRRTNLEPGDVLLTNCGASIGRVGIAQDDPRIYKTTFQKSISVIKPDRSHVDGRYLYYFLLCNSDLLIHLGDGTAQPNLLIGDLKRIEVPVPPTFVQRRIAGILSAYDDLIENNLRRIKILEEMAQNLYREWFVKFHFPDHQHARFTESPLGRIPERWEVVSLGKLTELRKDKFKEKLHSEYPLLDLAKMQHRTLSVGEMGSPDELTTSRIIFEESDILFGSIRPYLHKVALASCRGVTNVSVLVIRPAEISLQSFLAVLLSSIDTVRWADQHSTGTKMPVIKWDALQMMPVLMPTQAVLGAFEETVHPILQTIKSTSSRNQNIRRTRDLLLPKLISGEVDVSELDITVPEEAV